MRKNVLAIVGFILAVLVFLFGNNLYQQITGHSIFATATPTPTNTPLSTTIMQPCLLSDEATVILASWKPNLPEPVGLLNSATQEAFATAYSDQVYESTRVAGRFATIPQIEGCSFDQIEVNISARQEWLDTGMEIIPGQLLIISYLSGVWGFAPEDRNYGDGHNSNCCYDFTGLGIATKHGTLMGHIGNGATFIVGSHFYEQTTQQGHLFLRINDDILTDNYGSLTLLVIKYFGIGS